MRNIIFLYVLSLLRPSNTIIQVLNSTFQSLRENIQYQKQPIFLSFSYTFLLLLSSICMCFHVLIVTKIDTTEMAFHPSIWPIQVINVVVKGHFLFFLFFVTFELISMRDKLKWPCSKAIYSKRPQIPIFQNCFNIHSLKFLGISWTRLNLSGKQWEIHTLNVLKSILKLRAGTSAILLDSTR